MTRWLIFHLLELFPVNVTVAIRVELPEGGLHSVHGGVLLLFPGGETAEQAWPGPGVVPPPLSPLLPLLDRERERDISHRGKLSEITFGPFLGVSAVVLRSVRSSSLHSIENSMKSFLRMLPALSRRGFTSSTFSSTWEGVILYNWESGLSVTL